VTPVSIDRKTGFARFQDPSFRVFLLAALSVLLLFPELSRGGLSGFDDSLYAHEAKEMIQGGDWWSIHFNGELNFEYPPMFIWLEAASMKMLGVNDYAAKFPAALAGFGAIVILYLLTRDLTGDVWLAMISMCVLTATQPFLKYATHAMTDVPFAFFFTLALFFYVKGIGVSWYLLLMGMSIGCAILTRSVFGLLLFGIVAVHLILTGRYRVLWSPQWLGGCLIALLMPLTWAGSQYHLHGAEFLNAHLAFISSKVTGTAATGWRPSLGIFAYAKELLKYYWPWLPFMIAGLGLQIRAVASRRDAAAALPLVWLALVIAPISLAEIKYGRYLIPAFPALAMASAAGVNYWMPPGRRVAGFRVACIALLLAAGFPILFPAEERGTEMRTLAPVAERYSESAQRVIFYTNGDTGYGYQNQFLWYANRHTESLTGLPQLTTRLTQGQAATGIIDRPSFEKLMTQLPLAVARRIQVLARSGQFLCYRLNGAAA
jgi:4-amino-4-deoxy-L-arabinose transferase-like glycosyltransferase